MAGESEGRESGEASGAGVERAAWDRVSALWRQIKEHRIAQWAVGYVAVAYGIQHAVTLTSEALEWPHLVVRASMITLALGLPLVMTLAWYHGERASKRVSAGELSIIAILLVIASLAFYNFVRPAEPLAERPAVTAVTVAPSAAKAAGISVAVLPFLNLSGDPKEEYFSDGMTEEITSALAKIPKLPVVGRTSAFQFKGKAGDLRAIGRTLSAAYVLEGSVRQAGNRVRITAQLIKAETGDHVWTDSYDRDLKDVFAVQEDVAKAIAAALQVPLGLTQGETLVSNRDIDPDSYQNYLRAVALIRSRRTGRSLTPAISLLEKVVARQPNYAPAWATLAQAHAFAPIFGTSTDSLAERRSVTNVSLRKAEDAARKAIQLDPLNAEAYMSLGLVQSDRGQLLDAEQSYQLAQSLDPLNPDTLQEYSVFLAMAGRLKTAVAMREQLLSLEPLVPTFIGQTGTILMAAGDYAKALPIVQALPLDSSARAVQLAKIYAATGKYKEAADAALEARIDPGLFPPGAVETAARLLRTAPAPAPKENIPYLGSSASSLPMWVFQSAHSKTPRTKRSAPLVFLLSGHPIFRPLARRNDSKPWSEKRALSITGAPKAGRNSAIPPPATISRVIEGL